MLPLHSESSCETSTLTSREFLKSYRLIYSRKEKTQPTEPPLDPLNDQSDAPTRANPEVIASHELSIDTSIDPLNDLELF